MRVLVRVLAVVTFAFGAIAFVPPPVAQAVNEQMIGGEAVAGPGGATLTAGMNYSCAVKTDGSIACWGQSNVGAATPPAGQYRWVAARYDTTCAMQAHAGLTCWGWNDYGQLTPPANTSFTEVSPGGPFVCGIKKDGTLACWGSTAYSLTYPPSGTFSSVSSGYQFACAITTAGSLSCWGDNSAGQTNSPAGTYVAISAGGGHACAINTAGNINCWGYNSSGQAPASRTGPYRAVAAGLYHTCAIRADGTLDCWGNNGKGQLTHPAGTYTEIASGYDHTCARATNGAVACWGNTTYGQTTPPAGLRLPAGVIPAVDAGGDQTCMVGVGGAVSCWGDNQKGELNAPAGVFDQVSTGFDFSCGLKNDGTIACWGDDSQLEVTNTPAGQFIEVAAGFRHACAIKADGTTACWGWNNHGQTTAPAGTFRSIAAGNFFTCGLRYDGTLACWGDNTYNNESVPPAGTFVALSVGSWHACAIRTNTSLACWGYNSDGQIDAPATGTYVAVAAGTFNTCAITVTRDMTCWGANNNGESAPFSGSWQSITLYAGHGCSVSLATSSVVCWGLNNYGQSTPILNTWTPTAAKDGQPYSFTLAITSGWVPAPSFQALSPLPPGLSLASNGHISGTPTAPGHYSFSVGIANAIGPTLVATINMDVLVTAVRYSGTDRFKTAVAVSQHTFAANCGCTAYIAYAYNFPDALAGAAAAGTVKGPVLLTDTNSLNADTAAELDRLNPSKIIILGSAGVISNDVMTAAAHYAPMTVRYYGANRFKTAVDISKKTFPSGASTAYIAYAYNFPDALAGAAAAGTLNGPVLLTDTGTLDSDTATELDRLNPSKIVILGGAGVISNDVMNAAAHYAPLTVRYYGANRFETAANVSERTFSPGVPVAYIAYAYNFPDALAGAAAAGTVHGPILLVSTNGPIDAKTAAELTRLKPHKIIVLGSSGVVSDALLTSLKAYAVP